MTKSIQARSCAGTREKRRKLSKVACALFIYIETLYGWVLSINVLHPQKMPCGKANCPHKCVKLEAFFFFLRACLIIGLGLGTGVATGAGQQCLVCKNRKNGLHMSWRIHVQHACFCVV